MELVRSLENSRQQLEEEGSRRKKEGQDLMRRVKELTGECAAAVEERTQAELKLEAKVRELARVVEKREKLGESVKKLEERV